MKNSKICGCSEPYLAIPTGGPLGLIELKDAEHLGVTDHGKSQSQHDPDREKQSAKGSRNSLKDGSLAVIRLYHR